MRSRKAIRLGQLILTPGDPRVLVGDHQVVLRAQELALLELLVQQEGRFVNATAVARHLTRGRRALSESSVSVHIHRLRMRLAPVGLAIRTLRGFGYTLEVIDESTVKRVT